MWERRLGVTFKTLCESEEVSREGTSEEVGGKMSGLMGGES